MKKYLIMIFVTASLVTCAGAPVTAAWFDKTPVTQIDWCDRTWKGADRWGNAVGLANACLIQTQNELLRAILEEQQETNRLLRAQK